jgi:hypothetical protein
MKRRQKIETKNKIKFKDKIKPVSILLLMHVACPHNGNMAQVKENVTLFIITT